MDTGNDVIVDMGLSGGDYVELVAEFVDEKEGKLMLLGFLELCALDLFCRARLLGAVHAEDIRVVIELQ